MFGTKDKGQQAAETEKTRTKLMDVARVELAGVRSLTGTSDQSRQAALIAGIYLELCALRDRLAPMEGDGE